MTAFYEVEFQLFIKLPQTLTIGRFFHFIYQLLTFFARNPFRLVRLTVEIDHHGMAQRLDLTRFGILETLLHLETGVAHLDETAFAHNRVVEMHGNTEIKVDVDEDIFESQPVDSGLKDMLEVAASTHVEVVALRPVVDVVVRVEVAHADLDGTGEHGMLN